MARPIWNGALSFGLVNIPVRVYSAIREHDAHFHQLAPDGSRIQYRRVSSKSGEVVDYGDIRKGYETSKGKYVVFDKDELAELAPRGSRTVDIEDFVALEEIDPIYFDRTYHVAPSGDGAVRPYALLATVMDERRRVGIGTVVMREKQYLAAIRPYDKGLVMSTLFFADEVVPQSEIDGIPARRPPVPAKEKQLAAQIVDSLAASWDPSRYHDDSQEQLRARIEAKRAGGTMEAPAAEPEAEVLDLMEALRASLERDRAKAGSSGKQQAPDRKSGTKRAPGKKKKKTSAKKKEQAGGTPTRRAG